MKGDAQSEYLEVRLRKALDRIDYLERFVAEAIKDERRACAHIADLVRKRELAAYGGFNLHHLLAEEIRDRILMRPATCDGDWPELERRPEEKIN
jgi:hypothetical protein